MQELIKHFRYENGELYRVTKTQGVRYGKPIKTYNNYGYKVVGFNYELYLVHRVVFFMHHGYLPEFVDHINGIRDDNRIENLRAATKFENAVNCKTPSHNTTGYKNVSFDNTRNKYVVRIHTGDKYKHIGRFDDLELANLVAQEARSLYHGEFARHA